MPIKRFKIVSKVIIVIILIALICYFFFWLRRASAPQIFGKAFLKVNTTQKVIALTFDDGPNPEVTEKIIKLLKKYNAHATFFVIGENAKKYPEIIRNIFRNGNEIGNHSWNHEHLIYHSSKFILDQITKTDELIRNLGYAGEIHFRAPYGHKLIVLPYILMKKNRNHILWNIELDDWDSPAPEDMLQKFNQAIHPGAIVLLHDGYVGNYQSREATKRLVELILENYHKKGYQFVTISELLKYEENNYKLPNNQMEPTGQSVGGSSGRVRHRQHGTILLSRCCAARTCTTITSIYAWFLPHHIRGRRRREG